MNVRMPNTYKLRNYKSMIMRKVLIPFVFIFTCIASIASNYELALQHYSIKHGLSGNRINAIFQDSKDFIWICTDNGLNRFDSHSFTIYQHSNNDPKSIQSDDVNCAFEDSEGNLWFGTRMGLARFDRRQNEFENIEICTESNHTMAPVWSIQEIDNELWIGSYGGLFILNKESMEHRHVAFNDTIPGGNSVKTMALEGTANVWIGTEGAGLYIMNLNTKQLTSLHEALNRHTLLKDHGVKKIIIDSDADVWLTSYGGGLHMFNKHDSSFASYELAEDRKTYITSFTQDTKGYFWICLEKGGTVIFKKGQGIIERFDKNTSLYKKLKRCVYEDKKGAIWFGTYNNGVYMYHKLNKHFEYFVPYEKAYDLDESNSVLAIHEGNDKTLWIGTDGGGLINLHPKKNMVEIHKKTEGLNSIPENTILSLAEDNKNQLYIGTYTQGLSIYNLNTGKFNNFKSDRNKAHSLSDDSIWDIFINDDGKVWLGTNLGGVNIFDPKTLKFEHIRHIHGHPNSLSSDVIRCFHKDSQNNIWIGTAHGLNLYDEETGKFKVFLHEPHDPKSISNSLISCMLEDSNGNLWIGTIGGGINKFNDVDESFECFDKSNGLVSNIVYGMLEDQQGNLWVSTNRGLCLITPETGSCLIYKEENGLIESQFNNGAYYKSAEGKLFFGGIEGLCSFFPYDIRHNYHIPKITITDFSVTNQSIHHKSSNIMNAHISEVDTIFLNYRQNTIQFKFAALNFLHPESNQFSYKLEPFDEDWNYVGNSKAASYTNLSPGKYTFNVIGSNNDNIWNTQPYTIDLIISPPFYGTLWFKMSVVLLITCSIYLGIRLKSKKLARQQLVLKKMVEAKSQEIKEKDLILYEIEKKQAAKLHDKLNNEVIHKSKELSYYILLIINKNKLLNDLRDILKKLVRSRKELSNDDLKNMVRMINSNLSLENEWVEFDSNFIRSHKDFISKLKENYPTLTSYDLRLCSLYQLNVSTRDIAATIGISQTSVKMARYRLRKKLNLEAGADLLSFLKSFSKQEDTEAFS